MKPSSPLIASLFVVALSACNAAPTISIPTEPPSPSPTELPSPNPTEPVITTSPIVFTLTSPDVLDGGRLPVEYTCDGAGYTLALNWSGAPSGTKNFAVIMHHIAPETIHWYWVLYNIPADVTGLPKNVNGIGVLGNNINNGLAEYSPPCSKGPGDKTYTYTVYALSAEPILSVPASQVSRAVLLEAINDLTLASAEMSVVYSRP